MQLQKQGQSDTQLKIVFHVIRVKTKNCFTLIFRIKLFHEGKQNHKITKFGLCVYKDAKLERVYQFSSLVQMFAHHTI